MPQLWSHPRVIVTAALATLFGAGRPAGAMVIAINPDSGLAANAAALAAFQRSADSLDALFTDPIMVNINAGLSTGFSNANIIGSTSTVDLVDAYTTVRNALVADAARDPRDAIVAALPVSLTARLPAGRTLSGNLQFSKANGKALGMADLDSTFGAPDASITFNANFAFDYDRSDGIAANAIDFQAVATHELIHALGFVSEVDDVDQSTAASMPTVSPSTLDLFRFPGTVPVSAADFATAARELEPGVEAVTSDASVAYRMSTGISQGDGRQASHWKDDALTGTFIGIMDPNIGRGQTENITEADLRALSLIGYDRVAAVPEPTAVVVALVAAPLLARRRRVCSVPR